MFIRYVYWHIFIYEKYLILFFHSNVKKENIIIYAFTLFVYTAIDRHVYLHMSRYRTCDHARWYDEHKFVEFVCDIAGDLSS